MTEIDRAVRRLIYVHFARTGLAPSRATLAADLDQSEGWIAASVSRLARERALVLDDEGEIARALPFCAASTPFVVRAGGVTYHGNCAWDAFGLEALMGPSAEVELSCGCGCGEALELDADLVVHFAVPAARWWDDIGYT